MGKASALGAMEIAVSKLIARGVISLNMSECWPECEVAKKVAVLKHGRRGEYYLQQRHNCHDLGAVVSASVMVGFELGLLFGSEDGI